MAELFANSRSQQLAAGQPSDVLALCWILALAERDRSLKSARKGGRVNYVHGRFLARARAAPRPAVSIGGAGAQLWGLPRHEPIEIRWPRGGCGVCALWHFRLGDRALDRWACGRRTARGQFWSPVLADSEARRCFLFGTWRSAVAELFANSRSQQLAAGQPSDVLALCWILALAERDRSLKSARKGGRVNYVLVVSSRARGRRLGQRFRSAAPARSYGVCRGTTRSKPLAEGWLWRVCALAFPAG